MKNDIFDAQILMFTGFRCYSIQHVPTRRVTALLQVLNAKIMQGSTIDGIFLGSTHPPVWKGQGNRPDHSARPVLPASATSGVTLPGGFSSPSFARCVAFFELLPQFSSL